MIICIAAIGSEDGKEYVVFATDHMITTGTGQFEHSIAKYKKLTSKTYGMLAGQALIFEDLIKVENPDALTYTQIKEKIFDNFKSKKKEIIKNEIFSIYGINEEFFIEALQKQIPNPYINTILEKVSNFKLNTNILLVGFDGDSAQISEINEAGIFDFRNINFHTIGSGSIQASNTLLFQKHSKKDNLNRTLYNVFKAKRNAEVMQGVGKETDVFVLSKDSGAKELSEENMKKLKEIYEEELEFGKNHKKLKELKVVG